MGGVVVEILAGAVVLTLAALVYLTVLMGKADRRRR